MSEIHVKLRHLAGFVVNEGNSLKVSLDEHLIKILTCWDLSTCLLAMPMARLGFIPLSDERPHCTMPVPITLFWGSSAFHFFGAPHKHTHGGPILSSARVGASSPL